MGDEFNKPGAWEEAWQQAFDGTEQAPPDRVWKGLENSLMEQQLQRYKRKLFLYQWLAAASVMLLGIWAGWWMFIAQPQAASLATGEQGIQTEAPAATPAPTTGTSESGAAPGAQDISGIGPVSSTQLAEATDSQTRAIAGSAGAKQASNAAASPRSLAENSGVAGITETPAEYSAAGVYTPTQDALPAEGDRVPAVEELSDLVLLPTDILTISPLAGAEEGQLIVAQIDPSIVPLKAKLLLKNGNVDEEIKVVAITKRSKKDKSRIFPHGKLWIGASVLGSVFDPNMSKGEGSGLSWSNQPVGGKAGMVYTSNVNSWDQKENSLPSIDFKMDLAYRITNRWMFQSSFQYGSYQISTLTGTFTDPISNKTYPLYYSNFDYSRVQMANPQSRLAKPVDAINSYRFISIPVSLNYIMFENLVGLALTSGLSSEIFLGGEIEGKGIHNASLDTYTITAGEDSPFRKVHFNALLGVQLFYRAGPNHLITLEPTYKRAITNFHKNGTYFDSRPSQIGIAAGFRYILR
jgi:hypothetical protein